MFANIEYIIILGIILSNLASLFLIDKKLLRYFMSFTLNILAILLFSQIISDVKSFNIIAAILIISTFAINNVLHKTHNVKIFEKSSRLKKTSLFCLFLLIFIILAFSISKLNIIHVANNHLDLINNINKKAHHSAFSTSNINEVTNFKNLILKNFTLIILSFSLVILIFTITLSPKEDNNP